MEFSIPFTPIFHELLHFRIMWVSDGNSTQYFTSWAKINRKKNVFCVESQSEEVSVMNRATRLQRYGAELAHKQPIVMWCLSDWRSGRSDHCTGLKHGPAQWHLLMALWLSCSERRRSFFCIGFLEVNSISDLLFTF